jgi:hypothetical protein
MEIQEQKLTAEGNKRIQFYFLTLVVISYGNIRGRLLSLWLYKEKNTLRD